MKETERTESSETSISKFPSKSVTTPLPVIFSITVAAGRGSP